MGINFSYAVLYIEIRFYHEQNRKYKIAPEYSGLALVALLLDQLTKKQKLMSEISEFFRETGKLQKINKSSKN